VPSLVLDQPDVIGLRHFHAQDFYSILFDPVWKGPKALFDKQLTPLHIEPVSFLAALVQGDERYAIQMTNIDHRYG
jgi:hypothetical protein